MATVLSSGKGEGRQKLCQRDLGRYRGWSKFPVKWRQSTIRSPSPVEEQDACDYLSTQTHALPIRAFT
eukprot:2091965-Amphidinium_carterae.1